MQVSENFRIAPSILSADMARLGAEVDAVIEAGADLIHFDVMDNHYVPNLTFGAPICRSLVKYGCSVPIDVHLMVEPVDDLIRQFADAGARYISFHPEASRHIDRSIQLIRDLDCLPSLVLNPATPLSLIEQVLPQLDMILFMSVNPGFGGQEYIPYVTDKIAAARQYLDDRQLSHLRIEVDGGVKVHNIAEAAAAGADTFVLGSEIFGASSYPEIFAQLREQLQSYAAK